MTRWYIRANRAAYDQIKDHPDLTPIQKRLLSNRGITDPVGVDLFIHPKLHKLHDPFLMADMEGAVALVMEAISESQDIRIVGDYDQDGNSATMILIEGLSPYTDRLSYTIPSRIEDGYGLNVEMVDQAHEDGVGLIITCDNGISAFEAVERAQELGVKIIVTDHHQVVKDEMTGGDILPGADAVLNPMRADCPYPFKALCGAGVAFKLIQALYQEVDGDEDHLFDLLQYAAMGTVCDIVDLVDENRIFVIEGLKRMNEDPKSGIAALAAANAWDRPIDAYTLGFVLGPCINASGRLSTADLGVELFLQHDPERTRLIAERLVELNNERKEITEEGTQAAFAQIARHSLDRFSVLVLYLPEVHESVCGIVAGRVKDHFHRPTLVFSDSAEEGILKGSGRSIETYDMFEKLSELSDYFTSFGGHAMAAGFSLAKKDLGSFATEANRKSDLSADDLKKNIYVDLQLPLGMISYEIIQEIGALAPFGKGNSKPTFADKDIAILDWRIVGKNQNVLKMTLGQEKLDAISFDGLDKLEILKEKFGSDWVQSPPLPGRDKIDLVYQPEINSFNGKTTVQLKIIDVR